MEFVYKKGRGVNLRSMGREGKTDPDAVRGVLAA